MSSKTRKSTGLAKRGRPSSYALPIADVICERIGSGESLQSICRDEGMPHASTVFRWLAARADFRDRYARAREAQADAMAEEILAIADDASNDWIEVPGKKGEAIEVLNHEHINRARLRVDTRKWLMSKLAPKKYGERIETTVKGDPENPLKVLYEQIAGQRVPVRGRGEPEGSEQ